MKALRPGLRKGRPGAAINPLELLTWWEGRGGRHPLSIREIARKLGVAESTARKHLQTLREAGQVDDEARAQALAARRGRRQSGRPATAIADDALRALWTQSPNIGILARRLRASRGRICERLWQMGLLSQPEDASANSLVDPEIVSEVPVPKPDAFKVDPLFDTVATAKILGVKPGTLEVWRYKGLGPRFIKCGSRVVYRLRDLNDYLDHRTRKSTADPGPAA